jgi:hypothetical protein
MWPSRQKRPFGHVVNGNPDIQIQSGPAGAGMDIRPCSGGMVTSYFLR